MSNGKIIKTLAELVIALAKKYGAQIVVLTIDSVHSRFQKIFASKNILILGAKETGKTSLIYLIQHGRPFKIVEGDIQTADPTAFGVVLDHKFQPQKGTWLKIAKDLPGDKALRETWMHAIKELKPHGIIFMIDGRKADNPSSTMEDIRDYLIGSYESGPKALAVIHLFVNFSDQWGGNEVLRRNILRDFEKSFDDLLIKTPLWTNLRIAVHATQLSAQAANWKESERALQKFGADLSV